MKRKLFLQATIISFLFLALMSLVFYWNLISWNKRMNDLAKVPPRRYVDLSAWHNVDKYEEVNFFQLGLLQFDNIFTKTFYLLIILQSIFLLKRLKVKNGFVIAGWLLSSLIGGFFVLMANTFREYFVTGLNPYLGSLPIFFLLLQLIFWVYLNMLLFKRLAEKNSER